MCLVSICCGLEGVATLVQSLLHTEPSLGNHTVNPNLEVSVVIVNPSKDVSDVSPEHQFPRVAHAFLMVL